MPYTETILKEVIAVKSILCFGDSNTWGYDPASTVLNLPYPVRMEFGKRWPNVMNAALAKVITRISAGG